MLTEVAVTRYITPLREGGSLPGLVEADDLGTYVMKFTGAGQGRKTLVAEVVCGELAHAARPARARSGDGRPRPGAGARRTGPGSAGAAQVEWRTEPRDGLPLRCDRLRLPRLRSESRGGRADRLVRRAGQQRRPLLAQPQSADVARRPVAHRPRRHHDLAPPLARSGGLRRQAVRRLRPRARALRPRHRLRGGRAGALGDRGPAGRGDRRDSRRVAGRRTRLRLAGRPPACLRAAAPGTRHRDRGAHQGHRGGK